MAHALWQLPLSAEVLLQVFPNESFFVVLHEYCIYYNS